MGLITQFLLVSGHFTLNMFVALVCFAVAWLYYDAWLGRRDRKEGTKSLGFVLLSLSFVVHSVLLDQAFLATPLFGREILYYATSFFRISGYLVLIIGQLVDPLQPLPGYREGGGFGLSRKSKAILLPVISISLSEFLFFSYPLLAILTGFLYLRRATVGLEHHLKTISWSMFILGFSETLSLASTFRGIDNVAVANIVAPFGIVWFVEHLALLISIFILGKWVWGYLIKRLETQLLMIFTTTILIVFLVTTIFFTTTSIRNIRDNTVENLKINVGVLKYSLDSKKAEILSDAQVLAKDPKVISGVVDGERKQLSDAATKFLLTKKQSFLVILGDSGEILVRADDPDKSGGSMSEDSLVKNALKGEGVSSVVTTDGSMAPEVSVRSATPIYSGGKVVGAVVMGAVIDKAFVDGLKSATGLDASVYGDNVRSATTFVASDGKSRWIGLKEETPEIKKTVLIKGEDYSGSVNILNVPYYASYIPLKNLDNNPVGMLFVGSPQSALLVAASESIELTFFVTTVLMVISVFPAFYVSKYIIEQIR